MQWIRKSIPNSSCVYSAFTREHLYMVTSIADFTSRITKGNRIKHWKILKVPVSEVVCGGNDPAVGLEPCYAEKIQILKELGIWKEIALEVMPQESRLVDEANLYHMWEFQSPTQFFIRLEPILTPPQCFDRQYEGIFYKEVIQNSVMYVYFHSNKELMWREKQKLKNHIAGREGTAVEIITERMQNRGYGVMIILPYPLDFGLG